LAAGPLGRWAAGPLPPLNSTRRPAPRSLPDLEFALYTGGMQLEGLADRGAALGNDGLVLAPFKRRDNPSVLVPNAAAFRWDAHAGLSWASAPGCLAAALIPARTPRRPHPARPNATPQVRQGCL
jgi:hypothetical protein